MSLANVEPLVPTSDTSHHMYVPCLKSKGFFLIQSYYDENMTKRISESLSNRIHFMINIYLRPLPVTLNAVWCDSEGYIIIVPIIIYILSINI